MKKTVTLFALLSLCTLAGFTQTHITGSITVNTTWTVSGSPYIIDGNTLLQAGIKLTIEPGVRVEFTYNTTLLINGELDATGDSLNHITITSNSASPYSGEWNNIHFTSSSIPATYDVSGNYISGCIMKYCDILYGGKLNAGSLDIDNSSPYITNCTIKLSGSDGIYLDKGYPKIENCNISDNYRCGIYSTHHLFSHNIEINGNIITHNQAGGINIANMDEKKINITRNIITDNYNQGIFINGDGGGGSGIITINENSICRNTADTGAGIYIVGGFTINMTCNLIEENSASYSGGAMYIRCGYNSYPIMMSGNIIKNNTSASGDVFYFFFYTSYFYVFDIIDNEICNNTAGSGKAILNLWGGISVDLFHVHNNLIKDNTGFATFRLTTFNGWIYSNNIINNTTYEFYNTNLAGTLVIHATNNYWYGITDIDSRIYDFFDDGSISVVNYNPVLPDSAVVTPCVPVVITSTETGKDLTGKIIVYPNPVRDGFIIEQPLRSKESTLTIYDLNGVVRMQKQLNFGNTSIDITGFKSGIYILKLVNATTVETRKIIKE